MFKRKCRSFAFHRVRVLLISIQIDMRCICNHTDLLMQWIPTDIEAVVHQSRALFCSEGSTSTWMGHHAGRSLHTTRHVSSESQDPEAKQGNTTSSTGFGSIPAQAKSLGLLGVLPFWMLSPPVVSHLPIIQAALGISASDCATLQLSYGATILSFLGGVHWGLAMTSLTPLKATGERYIWSVVPCLAGFPTLVIPSEQAAAVQAALLGVVYVADRSWARRGGLPPWYMTLRGPLTVLAASGLAMTAVA